jgi:hypothetical protein
MNIARTLQISALLAGLAAPALAAEATAPTEGAREDDAAQQGRSTPEHALPTLPLFELPVRASDNARLHVGLAHARRDSHRAEHTRAGQDASAEQGNGAAQRSAQKPVQRQLAAARDRVASAQVRSDAGRAQQLAAQERRAAAGERRADAQERRAAAARHRDAAAQQRLNAAELQAAAQERRASAGRK